LQKFIAKDGDERRVLSVHIVSQQTDENASTETEPVEITNMDRHKPISDIVTFKSCKELYPIALPFLDIKAKGKDTVQVSIAFFRIILKK